MPTFWRIQFFVVFVAPSSWEKEWRISVRPEIIAFRVAIKVHAQSVSSHFRYRHDAVLGWVTRIYTLALHTHFESILPTRERL